MKLGVSINVFDGREHLKDCIQSARQWADYVHVCISYLSNDVKYTLPRYEMNELQALGADSVTIYRPRVQFEM
jgi:hypothetical protein